MADAATWPQVRTAGYDGFLISFAEALSEPANRAALACRAAIEAEGWDEVSETSTSLVSTFLRFDPLAVDHATMRARIEQVLEGADWFAAALPEGRSLWRVPTVFGTDLAPQLEEAALLAGLTVDEAVESLSQTRLRVQTIGFAPGQPYLGELPKAWDIPRQTALTARVPVGAVAVAIRQIVLFSVSAPTGWRHVGQTALKLFQPEAGQPFVLRPGDEVLFTPTDPNTLAGLEGDPMGGAVREDLP